MDKLAAFAPQDAPVISLFLNLSPDQHGRDNYDAFIRKAFAEHAKAFKDDSTERASLEQTQQRITAYLADEVHRAANGLALFASSGADDLFEAIQLDAPFEEHLLFVDTVPHLYPLARVSDQYPRYASVLLDTNQARIFVFALGSVERRTEVVGEKTRRNSMGGWSQARYQRRADNVHVLHVKEVVETLERIVRTDRIQHIIVAGDDVVVPLFKQQLPKELEEKLVDVLSLARDSGEDEIIRATLDVLRRKDAETDAGRVQELIGAWQSRGLGVVGPEATLRALELGQVDELLISGSPENLKAVPLPNAPASGVLAQTSAPAPADERKLKLADELVTRAQQTGARVRIIEDSELLNRYGGVGALLRFRV